MHLVFFGWLLFLSFLIMFTKETEQKTNSWVKSINGLMDRPRCLTSCLIFQALCYCITIFLHILIPTKCQFFYFEIKKLYHFLKRQCQRGLVNTAIHECICNIERYFGYEENMLSYQYENIE